MNRLKCIKKKPTVDIFIDKQRTTGAESLGEGAMNYETLEPLY